MRTFSLLKGLPVYGVHNGKNLGEVFDISITSDGKVNGLLLKRGTFLNRNCLIRIENVASFGKNGIMVNSDSVIEQLKNPPEFTLEHRQALAGKPMLSSEGEKLGLLDDVYFMEEMGTIIGYELTDGFFSDITEGKRVVKAVEPPAIGKDAIIVNLE
ncbi:PRC-barrel domain-containing protein [Mesobacillus harenae]|uniref:PRC-barrel domain-containing protein n=1 Tax=Mesobacillus harenae TaxID=2213203 RepID=UPI001580DDF5|nr:PRC-barrel domain-containing protein [Mesobacillus harenae]